MPNVARKSRSQHAALGHMSRLSGLFNKRRMFAACGVAVWCVVSWNAVYRQEGPHPAPLFAATGDGAVREDAVVRAPETPALTIEQQITATQPPMPRQNPATVADPENSIVGQIQAALVERGYDAGTVDGVFGPKTRSAIIAFERDNRMAQTGEPSVALLARINLADGQEQRSAQAPQPSVATQPVMPPVRPQQRPAVGESPITRYVRTQQISIDELISGAKPTSVSMQVQADPGVRPPEPVGDPTVRAVQKVLADLGYAPGSIDGVAGEATRRAIAQFRADHRMGPGDTVTTDLIAKMQSATGEEVLP